MKYVKIVSFVSLLIFLLSVNIYAQDSGNLKIGYVDVNRLFDEYSKTDQYDKTLEDKFSKWQEEHNRRLEKIRETEGKLAVLKEEEKNKIQAGINRDKADLSEFDRQQQTNIRLERDEKIREILVEIEKIIKEFAEKEKYALILNDKVLVYGQGGMDVTDKVAELLSKE